MSSSTSYSEIEVKQLIAKSEATIARLRSRARLREERANLARLRALIAPVRKLSAELLAAIFLLAVQGFLGEQPGRAAIQDRQTLSQVCAHWRGVAHTTPQLWTVTVENTLRKTPTANYLASLKNLVDRSAPHPVPVHLRCRGAKVDIGPIMDLLCAVAPRWKSAEFHIPSLSALVQRIQPASGSLHSLTTLVVVTDSVPDAAEIQAFSQSIPWTQLTSLTLGLASQLPAHCLRALVQCTNLVSAEIETEGWGSEPDFSSMEMATLTKLTSLSLSFVNRDRWQRFTPFLTRLALPALRVLRLRSNKKLSWDGSTFSQFQLRSPGVDFLEISDCWHIQSYDLQDVLQNWPSLRTLEMRNCPDACEDDFFTFLTYSPTSSEEPPVAPNLECIKIVLDSPSSEEENYDIHEEVLDAMIDSRWWTKAELRKIAIPPPVACWKSVHISIQGLAGDFSRDFSRGIKNFRTQGLDVKIDWTVRPDSDCESDGTDSERYELWDDHVLD